MAKQSELSKHLAKLGRKGGTERMKRLSAEERKKLASEAGKASGKARKKKAKAVKHG